MDYIKIRVPATSANLGSGFDSLGLALSLGNTMSVQRATNTSVRVHGEGSNSPKIQENAMFLSIFTSYYQRINNKMDSFKFIFNNNVPISRGLGSSSIVILSAIYSAYLISGVKISKRELLNLALVHEKHADNITPATYGGFCVSSIHNDRIISTHKAIPNYVSALLVIPSKPMSTKMSRKILPMQYSKDDVCFNISRSSLMVSAFMNHKWDLLKIASQDRIHEYYRMQTFPELINIKKKIARYRPLMTTLSGSGSTIFSMFYSEDIERVKQSICNSFSRDFRVITSGFDNTGISQIH
ncbi:Homoserine kinase [hydrothermal vent metagenome]|uniref:Homoserine kinase n=1 Tax=hydrothermal vent metagenome TaxID=652676 RepID=A0A3B1DY67_9ZZZZ